MLLALPSTLKLFFDGWLTADFGGDAILNLSSSGFNSCSFCSCSLCLIFLDGAKAKNSKFCRCACLLKTGTPILEFPSILSMRKRVAFDIFNFNKMVD